MQNIFWEWWQQALVWLDCTAVEASILETAAACVQVRDDGVSLHNAQLWIQNPQASTAIHIPADCFAIDTWIVTGPNAGGKSAFLASLAQWHYWMHCGYLETPAQPWAPGSTAENWPGNLWFDGGDQQDLHSGHSSYSAHLEALRRMHSQAHPGDWILIDELGSKTDPEEGGALAARWLDTMARRGCRIVTSTHLPAIKQAAVQSGYQMLGLGLLENLQPDFFLRVGVVSRSHALEAARRAGWDTALVDQAESDLGQLFDTQARHERMQQALTAAESELAGIRQRIAEEEKRLERMRTEERAALEAKFRQAYAQLLDEAADSLQAVNRPLLRKASSEETKQIFLEKLRNRLDSSRQVRTDESGQLGAQVLEGAGATKQRFAVGDQVRHAQRQTIGRIAGLHSPGLWKVEWQNGWIVPEPEASLRHVAHHIDTGVVAAPSVQAPRLTAPFVQYNERDKEYIFQLHGVRDEEALEAIVPVFDYMMVSRKALQIRVEGRRRERMQPILSHLQGVYGIEPRLQRSAEGRGWVLSRI